MENSSYNSSYGSSYSQSQVLNPPEKKRLPLLPFLIPAIILFIIDIIVIVYLSTSIAELEASGNSISGAAEAAIVLGMAAIGGSIYLYGIYVAIFYAKISENRKTATVLLGIFLGLVGGHDFYNKRYKSAVLHICLFVLTLVIDFLLKNYIVGYDRVTLHQIDAYELNGLGMFLELFDTLFSCANFIWTIVEIIVITEKTKTPPVNTQA